MPPKLDLSGLDYLKDKVVVVAYSGGMDSTVLLHQMQQLKQAQLIQDCCAVHVHHGLSDDADAWAAHCEAVCQQWGIAYQCQRLANLSGPNLEKRARDARYAALIAACPQGAVLVMAHHRDDQAETFLLQALRGAGPRGLASMPVMRILGEENKELRLVRPLLSISRETLEAYAQEHGLTWVEDASNQQLCFRRNFLRQKVMPLLESQWPQAGQALAKSAEHAAQSVQLLEEMQSTPDWQACVQGSRLQLAPWLQLSELQQAEVMRVWLKQSGLQYPSQAQLNVIMQCAQAKQDAKPQVDLQGFSIRRFQDQLWVLSEAELAMPPKGLVLDWNISRTLVLPCGLGELNFESLQLEMERPVESYQWTVKFRSGGERYYPPGAAQSQSLKKLLQAKGIPTWQRDRIPLIYADHRLVAIAW